MSRKDKEEKQIYSDKWSPETSVESGPNILGYAVEVVFANCRWTMYI